jgi:2-C-methyl-D-erythritol 4-phosphate cytidylyltransferase
MNAQQPKQYLKLENGLSVLDQTLKTLLNIEKIKPYATCRNYKKMLIS